VARSTSISVGVVLGFYPPPIAHAFQRATNAEAVDADVLHEDLLGALLAHLAWTCALATGGDAILRAREGKVAPLGSVLRLLGELCASARGNDCEPLLGANASQPSSFAESRLKAALESAIKLRNLVIHEHRLDLRDDARAAVRGALDQANEIRFHAFVVPRALEDMRGNLRVYRAACYRGVHARHPVWIETDAELVPKRAYLAVEGRALLLPLHPLVIEAESNSGSPLPELYAVRDLGKLSVRAIATGREAPPRVRDVVADAVAHFESVGDAWIAPKRLSCPGLELVAPRRLGPGDIVAGRYSIVRHLGSGSSADVYEASDRDGSPVALKLISAEIAAETEALVRFRREVSALEKIHHRNVVRYLIDGEDAGTRFLATELASGWTFDGTSCLDAAMLLANTRATGVIGLDEDTVRHIARDVAAALSVLHERNLVHRDVKLANVLLFNGNGDRRAVLGDLGIARAFGHSSLTLRGMPVGTPEAMAPEASEDTEAAPTLDVYAFGILLYEALAGAPPYRGTTPQDTREKHKTRLPRLRERAPHVSESLAALVHGCLAKNPSARPAHGAELYKRIQRLHEPVPSAASTVDIVRGHRLGAYAVREPIGSVHGATLFQATDTRTGDSVRIGILDDAIEANDEARARALKVLAILQALNCETLVRVREYGEGDGYTWFLVEDAAPRSILETDGLDAILVLDLIAGAARALSALHGAGVGHGDVARAVRFHDRSSTPGPRTVLDLPSLCSAGDHAGVADSFELRRLARAKLGNASVDSGHKERVRHRALAGLERLPRRSDSGTLSLATWAAASAAEMRDTSMAGRVRRVVQRNRGAAATGLLAVSAGLALKCHDVYRRAADVKAASTIQREIIADALARNYCGAVAAIESDASAVQALPILRGRKSLLAILCASTTNSSPPPVDILWPLASAVELPERQQAMEDVKWEPLTILKWATDTLTSHQTIPPALSHAFWRVCVTAVGEANRDNEPISSIETLLIEAEFHFDDAVPPRARDQLDACVALRLKYLVEAHADVTSRSVSAIELADRTLARADPPWNRYTIECYRALAMANLAERKPAMRPSVCALLEELADARRRDAGRDFALRVSDRVYEPGFRRADNLSGISKLAERCAERSKALCPR
jgi:hypothetical protein